MDHLNWITPPFKDEAAQQI